MIRGVSLSIGLIIFVMLNACSANSGKRVAEDLSDWAESESAAAGDVMVHQPLGDFDADSAYNYVAKQVAFGPRVPNTNAHKEAGDWLASELGRHGAKVTQQKARLIAFDGTELDARNIFAQYNPDAKERILLLAHWDCRPWADKDPDPDKRRLPVDGANDGASGVAVLLELARQLGINPLNKGVDFLLVDAEDWGEEGDDDSWALGTKYFVENPIIKNYRPQAAILLDMVGGDGAVFCREYFSERSNPALSETIWRIAAQEGYGNLFLNRMGTAVLDDHVELIKAGIPAIDIIEYHPEGDGGFNSRWHTASDNLQGISKQTLEAVGKVMARYLYQ